MDNFENALGWYRVSTKSMCEIRIENKELELLNFNPCGSSTFKDKDEKIYMMRTCEIDSMKPCKEPKTEEDEKFASKCEFGIGLGIYEWCKEHDMPFIIGALRNARNQALGLLNGKLHTDEDYNKKTLQCYIKLLQLKQYCGRRFNQSDVI